MLPSFWNQLVPSRSTHILSFLDFLICEIDQHIKPCFSVQRVHIKPSQPKKKTIIQYIYRLMFIIVVPPNLLKKKKLRNIN
jgi:hypothetical protein